MIFLFLKKQTNPYLNEKSKKRKLVNKMTTFDKR